MLHFAQLINSGRFQQFDYKDKNTEIYNNPTPPDYPLQLISGLKFYFFYGTRDTLMAKKDVTRLADHLRYRNDVHVEKLKDFNHLDYIFGSNVTEILYRPIVDQILRNNFEDVTES